MKSVKEKAEERAPYTREDSWNKAQKCIIAQTSFEAGANYVIAEIERVLSSNGGTSRLEIAIIKDVIDKLKEK